MTFGKRQLVLAALVVALGAAVYLNWQFSGNNDLLATNTVESGKELGEAEYVNQNSVSSLVSGGEESSQEGNDSSTTSISASAEQYFAQAKVSRKQARDEAMDTLKDVLDSVQSNDSAKAEAVKQAAEIAKNMEQENNIENLMKAKGFAECVAFIQNGECSVVVSTTGLLDNEAITIKDIVAGQSGITYDKIKIIEAK
ncbi:MAG: SpoIIIAH-like family protein [Clostridiales bacterium]|nr:SpoIIIAH-like family protein [Clostridiales bacterium]